jgi:hypothetical protein
MLFLFFFLSLLAPSLPPAAFVKTSLPPLDVRLVLARLDDDDDDDDVVVLALPNDRPLFAKRIICCRLRATTRDDDDDADEEDDDGQQQDDARILDSLSFVSLCFACVGCARRARARFTSCFLDKVSSSRPKIVFFSEISLL